MQNAAGNNRQPGFKGTPNARNPHRALTLSEAVQLCKRRNHAIAVEAGTLVFVWFCEASDTWPGKEKPLEVQESNAHLTHSVSPAISRQCLRQAQPEGQFCQLPEQLTRCTGNSGPLGRPLVKDVH